MPVTRKYKSFVAWVPPPAAAMFADLSLEIRDDSVEQEIEPGVWSPIAPTGDYPRLAPAALEARKNRLALVVCRRDPELMPVGPPSDLTVDVWITPRFRTIPPAAE